MDTTTIIIIVAVIAALVVLALAAYAFMNKRKQGELRGRFGPEYDRAVDKEGRRKAERELSSREKRVQALAIRDLSGDERDRFSGQWREVQAKFVDAPRTALQHADVLVQEVMNTRGYPVSDFEQRAADVSVDHGSVVSNYRAGHEISQRADSASTEEMRQAMIHYRSLFDELLGTRTTAAA
jgi:hypothetical protein